MNNTIFLVGLGGAGGSILRYLIQRAFPISFFPYGTLIVNLSGCLIIGILWGLFLKNNLTEVTAIFLMTGFCGGFTTFSAFSYEGIQLLMVNKWLMFFTYTIISIAGGMIATYLGFKVCS
jgi:CrcB protein